MSALLWALVALPLTAGTLLAVLGRTADRAAPAAGVASAVLALGLACAAAAIRPHASAPLLAGLPAGFTVDGLSAAMAVTVTAVTAAVLAFAAGGADTSARTAPARFFGLMLVFSGAMLVTVTATGLPLLLMGWEVMGAASWALIGHVWRDPARVSAANTAFLTTRASDLGLYVAAGAALAAGSGATLAASGGGGGGGGWGGAGEGWRDLALAGVILAALGKSAQLPFSYWLSSAMRGPAPVSALLHAATMVVAGAYLLLRYAPALRASGWGADVVTWAGAGTALALGLVAVAQTDLKQLLAASSSAQIGFMVCAAGVGSVAGGALHLLAHAAAKSLAFLVAGAWLTSYGTQALAGLRGAARSGRRVHGVSFTVAALALAGVPPFAVWAAKDVLLAAARTRSAGVYAVALAASVVAAVYSAKLLYVVWQRALPGAATTRPDGSGAAGPAPSREVRDIRTAAPLLALALACVGLGAVVLPPVWGRFVGSGGPGAAWEFAVSGAGALAVCAVVWRWGAAREARGPRSGRLPRWLPRRLSSWLLGWLGLDWAVRTALVAPTLRLARGLAAFDVRVLDRAVDGAARAAVHTARYAACRVEPAVDGAVEGLAAAARALGRRARRPQTGQLHQYLAQAVAACALLAFVLVLVR